MKLDPHTYGNTPAAIYLVEILNQLNDEKFTRKVGRRITGTAAVVRQLEDSHAACTMTTKTLGGLVNKLRAEIAPSAEFDLAYDGRPLVKTALDLTNNICVGILKQLLRRTRTLRLHEAQQARFVGRQRNLGIEVTPVRYDLEHVKDAITPESLQARSRRKLIARGKPHALY